MTAKTAKSDEILESIYGDLGLVTDEDKLNAIYPILDKLSAIKRHGLGSGVWGTITERLVEVALRKYAKGVYFKVNRRNDEWVGDFGLFGIPFNTIISVKSYSAKERALTSGSGSALCPTILYAHFLEKNYKEFDRSQRLQSYKVRGFTSIYLPKTTFNRLSKEARDFKNINQKPLIRKIEEFGPDIQSATKLEIQVPVKKGD